MSWLSSIFRSNDGNDGKSVSAKNPDAELKDFLSKSPQSKYTFDSERDAQEAKLCREAGERGRECIMIHMHSTKLFEAMQANGFFCALPIDPARTHIECTPLPKA